MPEQQNPQAPIMVRQESPGSPPQEGGPSVTPEIPKTPSVAEFAAGGEKEKRVTIDDKTRKNVRDRLEERIRIAQFLQKEERPLTQIDRILLESGDRVAANLESGNLTREDAAVSYYALYDEAIQKFLASGKMAALTITEGKVGEKRHWLIKHKDVTGQVQEMKTAPLKDGQRQSSEYTRKLGFETWGEARIDTELKSLTKLIHTVESSLMGLSPGDTLLDERLSTFSPFMVEGKTGNFLRDQVFDELMGPEGILTQRHEGKTFLELWNEDPTVALGALNEANQRALSTFADQTAKEHLSQKKPKANTELIEQQAAKLEVKSTQEDLTKAQENAERARSELTEAETKFNDLNAPVENAKRLLAEKQLVLDRANATFIGISERLNPEIQRMQNRAELLYNSIQQPDPSLTAEQKAEMQRNVAAISQNAARIEEAIKSYQDRLNQLRQQQIDSQLDFNQQQGEVTRLEQEAKEKGLDTAKADFDAKKTVKENAEIELKKKQNAGEAEISEEAKEKARGLRKWKDPVTGYDKIIDARFSQTHADEYSRERLADIEETADGQIKGAERIREHIFRLVNEGDYDPVLARKMLSDETIARAIAWTYKIDLSKITTDGSVSITKALPYLRSSQFQVGDLMRFVVSQGVKSAERGNPYLQLDKYFETPKPELQLEAESIYREGIGEIKMKDNKMKWEGTIVNPIDTYLVNYGFSKSFSPYCSSGIAFYPDHVDYNSYIKADRAFLESLPTQINDLLPEDARHFYDESGKLRTDKRDLPLWVRIYDGTPIATDRVLDTLDNHVSSEFSQLMTSAVSDYFLKRPKQERLQALRGFRTIDSINDVALAENQDESHNYTIGLDNIGNFFIQDISNPASPEEEQELSSFFKRRLESFKGTRTSLNKAERKLLQEEFLEILSPLGREILRSQQRR